MNTLHIIEPHSSGHRMEYVRHLVEGLGEGVRVHLSTFPSSRRHPALLKLLEGTGRRVTLHEMAGEDRIRQARGPKSGFWLQPRYWKLFRSHWKALPEDERGGIVAIPYLDYISYAVGLFGSPFGSAPFSGVLMRPDFHWRSQGVVAPRSRMAPLRRALFRRMLDNRNLARVATTDRSLLDWASTHMPRSGAKLQYCADPTDLDTTGDRMQARSRFGLAADDTVILLYGSVEVRKGIARLLRLLAGERVPATVKALVVGLQTPEAERMLGEQARLGDRLVVVNEFVDKQVESLAFAAADYVWLAYEGFYGPSGVLSQCRAARRPVIHTGEGLIGHELRNAQLEKPAWLASERLFVGLPATPQAGVNSLAMALVPELAEQRTE